MAVPIVKLGKGGYQLDETALRSIVCDKKLAQKRVAIVSVAGAFRKGKSFLLNFLVLYLELLEAKNTVKDDWFTKDTLLNKFNWRCGSQSDTLGITMWKKPFIIKDQDGEEVVVLLMDTQGTFDSNSTIKECVTIFALSTLISSLQILNVSQNIQEDDLNNLQLFTEFAKLAKKSGDQAPFQKLLFLVRDWQNSDEHEYGYDGGEKFLEVKLKTRPDMKPELQTVRRDLSSSFEEMECFLMPHPGKHIANNNKQQTVGVVDDEFKEQLMKFVPSVFKDIQSKKLNGQTIECAQIVPFFKSYMGVLNGDTLPDPKTVFKASVEASNNNAVEKAKSVYKSSLAKVNKEKATLADFLTAHEGGKKAATAAFNDSPRFGGDGEKGRFFRNLNAYMQERYDEGRKVIEEHEELRRKKREHERREREARERQQEEDARQRRLAADNAAAQREIEQQRLEVERQRAADEQRREEENNKPGFWGTTLKVAATPGALLVDGAKWVTRTSVKAAMTVGTAVAAGVQPHKQREIVDNYNRACDDIDDDLRINTTKTVWSD